MQQKFFCTWVASLDAFSINFILLTKKVLVIAYRRKQAVRNKNIAKLASHTVGHIIRSEGVAYPLRKRNSVHNLLMNVWRVFVIRELS